MKNIIETSFTILATILVATLLSMIVFALCGSIVAVLLVVVIPSVFIVYTAIEDYKATKQHEAFMNANV